MGMSNEGKQNKEQTRKQIEKQDHRNQIELGEEFTIGNTKSQSQKKSGRQSTKNNLGREVIFYPC